MNTAAISAGTSTSVFEGMLALGHEKRQQVFDAEDTRTEPPRTIEFDHEIGRFVQSVGKHRDRLRSSIVRKILKAEYPDEYMDATLRTLLASSRPGRLDDAVDILSETGPVLPQFVREALSQPEQGQTDEDFWYVLIRAFGKSRLPSARMHIALLWLKSPEGGVEALGDLGDAESFDRLRRVARSDSSDFIRQLAAEIVDECSS